MKKSLLLILPVFLLFHCSSDDESQPEEVFAPIVSNIQVKDITNNGNGSDLEISFDQVNDESFLSEYRIFVVRQSEQSTFNLEKALSTSMDNYLKLLPDATNKKFTLNINSNDNDGMLITESIPYVVFVMSVADGVNAMGNSLSTSSSVITLGRPILAAASNIELSDVADLGNASDMEITFTLASTDNISEIRMFIVKEEQSSSFDLAQAESLESSKYIDVDLMNREIRLSDTDTDIDANEISQNVRYVAFVMSVAEASSGIESVLSNVSSSIALSQFSLGMVTTLTDDMAGGTGGMDVDADGNIYMGDFGASLGSAPGTMVFKITPSGGVSTFATGLVGASGNDFDNDGNLLQSNIGNGTVSKITPAGTVTTLATGFSSPVGVTVDQNGDFYVCNCGANSISKVTNNGATVSTFVTSNLFNCPNGIDIDSDGNLYVANFSNNNLVKITPSGQASVLATLPGTNNGHPLINGDFIYVISRGLHQIHRITFDGHVSLFAGSGTRGREDGPVLEASFSFPNDLAFSPDGKKMYVNDVNAGSDGNVLSPSVIRVIDIVE